MILIALNIAFVAIALSLLLAMIRLLKGPNTGDRILALDTMVVNAIALIILLGMRLGTQIYFESAMIFAMLGFVSTVALRRVFHACRIHRFDKTGQLHVSAARTYQGVHPGCRVVAAGINDLCLYDR